MSYLSSVFTVYLRCALLSGPRRQLRNPASQDSIRDVGVPRTSSIYVILNLTGAFSGIYSREQASAGGHFPII